MPVPRCTDQQPDGQLDKQTALHEQTECFQLHSLRLYLRVNDLI
jgi:hypothetical protein